MTKICLIASNSHEAYNFAKSQYLEDNQWFYPKDTNDLLFRTNFHVIVVKGAEILPPILFEKMYKIALIRGAIGRI